MPKHESTSDDAHHRSSARPSQENSTAKGIEGSQAVQRALLISAYASLITALTGVAVLLLNYF